MRLRLGVLWLLLLGVASRAAAAELTITPAEGSENPVVVGQLVTLDVAGLSDSGDGKVLLFPRLAKVLPVLTGGPAGASWHKWGDRSQILFEAEDFGDYLVGVMDTSGGGKQTELPWAEYIVQVRGEPPPPPPIPTLVIEPDEPMHSEGAEGGPFTPRVKSYALRSSGEAIAWTASVDVSWLGVLPAEGMIGPREVETVDVILAPAANELGEGTHEGTVTFLAGDDAVTREVTLKISDEPPPPQDLWVIVVYESSQITPAQQVVLTSQSLRGLLKATHFKVADKDASVLRGDLQSWVDLSKDKALPIIYCVSESGKALYQGPLPETVEDCAAVIRRYLPRRQPARAVKPPAQPCPTGTCPVR